MYFCRILMKLSQDICQILMHKNMRGRNESIYLSCEFPARDYTILYCSTLKYIFSGTNRNIENASQRFYPFICCVIQSSLLGCSW